MLTEDKRNFFEELFANENISRMYIASLMSSGNDLQKVESKQCHIRLLKEFFGDGKHPQKDYYIQKIEEIEKILEKGKNAVK